MQIIAPLHREDLCLRLAYLFEQAVGWPVLPSEPWIR
jgi:Asp-tRNA(Asn)/Glu-tRNA(Gln) amidotransferase A subunit family amidase